MHERLSSGRTQVRPPKCLTFVSGEGLSAAEGAAERARVSSLERGFGRRRCRRKCPVQPFHGCFLCMLW
ncbi:hypothetical protein MANES_14G162975v8 [Manihot esculenta]|uniref:Uncharacterized protein n=1 Tax=Manihot esculenta TaxID=3983 RepID=A0ACB7GHC6_MANES|nr:hypothetical protein MANES_14G162975v8 [Manihot esculenta]